MKIKRRAKITVETHEITVIRFKRSRTATVFCETDQAEVPRFDHRREPTHRNRANGETGADCRNERNKK